MKNTNVSRKKGLGGKGFYIALSLCVAMVGAACYFAYSKTSDKLVNQLDSGTSRAEQNVMEQQQNVPKLTTAVTTTSPQTTTVTTTETDRPVLAPQPPVTTSPPKQTKAVAAVPKQTEPADPPPALPVTGEVVQPFSNGELVKSSTTGAWQTHNGVDLAGALGDPVRCMSAGTVTEIARDGLWGTCVTVDHGNGIISRYCSLNENVSVEAGQVITGGAEIGTIGQTAEMESTDGGHLHFEVLRDGAYIDPVAYVKEAQ